MAVPKEKLPVRKMLESISPQSKEASQMILGLDDLLVLFCECEDENDLEKPYYVYATPDPKVLYPNTSGKPCCPNCKDKKGKDGRAAIQGPQQYKCREIDDCPIRGHRTIIRVLYNSWMCDGCGSTWTPQFQFAPERGRLTSRHAAFITDASFQKLTFEQVAYEHHVSHVTVKDLFKKEAMKRDQTYKFETRKHIGIDETKIKNIPKEGRSKKEQDLLCVVLMATDKESDPDLKHHGIIDIVKTKRNHEAIEAQLGRFANPNEIETVTMDMCSAYRVAVQSTLHNARIIVDRFHLVKNLNDKLRRTSSMLYYAIKTDLEKRLDIPSTSDDEDIADGDEYDEFEYEDETPAVEIPSYIKKDASKAELVQKYKILKNCYHSRALTANADKLAPSTKAKLWRLFDAFPEFETIYTIKEIMRVKFFMAEDDKEAEQIAIEQKERVPSGRIYRPLREFFALIDKESEWGPYVYEYFKDPVGSRYSNAALENINSHIKDINRMSRGLTWDIFRLKVLYGDISVREHGKRFRSFRKRAFMEFLEAAVDRRMEFILPDIDSFDLIFNSPEFQATHLGKVFSGKSTNECIKMILENNNMAGFLFGFLQSSPAFADADTDHDPFETVGIIRPLYLPDWDANAKQYLAMLDSDTTFMEKLSATLD